MSNGIQYIKWAKLPEYKVACISKDLEVIIPEDSVVLAGITAAGLFVDNRVFCIPFDSTTNHKNTFDNFPITHICVEKGYSHEKFLISEYPSKMANSILIKEYEDLGKSFRLFQVKN